MSQSPMDGLQFVNLFDALNKQLFQMWHKQKVKWDNTSLILDIIFKLMLLKDAFVLVAATSYIWSTKIFFLGLRAAVFGISWFSWWEK